MSYNGGGLNWDQVAAPSFSGVNDGMAAGAAMLDNAIGKLGELNVAFGKAQGDNEAKKLLQNIYNYKDGNSLLDARSDGSLFSGVDFSKMSAEQMAGVNQYVKEQYGIDGLKLDNQGKLLGHDLTRAQTDSAKASTANTYNTMRINSSKHDLDLKDRTASEQALSILSSMNEDELQQFYESGGLGKLGINNQAALKAAMDYVKDIHGASNIAVPSANARRALTDSKLADEYAIGFNNLTNTSDQQEFLYSLAKSGTPGMLDSFTKATGMDPRSVLTDKVIDDTVVNKNGGGTFRSFATVDDLEANDANAQAAKRSDWHQPEKPQRSSMLLDSSPELAPKNEKEMTVLVQAAEQGNPTAQQIVSEITANNGADSMVQQPQQQQSIMLNQNQTPATALDEVMARVPQGVNQQQADTMELPDPDAQVQQQQPNNVYDNVIKNAMAMGNVGSGGNVIDTLTQQSREQGIANYNADIEARNDPYREYRNDPVQYAAAQNKAVPTFVDIDRNGNVKDTTSTLVKSLAGTTETGKATADGKSKAADIILPEADAAKALELEERITSNPQLAELVDGMTIGEIINKGAEWDKATRGQGIYGISNNPGAYAAAQLSKDLKQFLIGDSGGFFGASDEYKEVMNKIKENPDILNVPFSPEVIAQTRGKLYGSRGDKIDEATKERNKNIEAKERESERKLRERARSYKKEAAEIVEKEASKNPKLNDPVAKARAINDMSMRLAYNSMVKDKEVDKYEKNVDPKVKRQTMLANHTKAVISDPNYVEVLAKDMSEKADTYLREIEGTTSINADKYKDVPNDPNSIANAIIERHPNVEFDKDDLLKAIRELGQDPDIKGNYQTIAAVIDQLGPDDISSGWFNRDGIISNSGRKKVVDLISKNREFKSSAQYKNVQAYRAELASNIDELARVRAELSKIRRVGDKDMERTAIAAMNNLIYNILSLEDKIKPKK